ncbi:MAG: hypothetical protein HY098_04140 [Nitrospinae bacterium]|nr:hypothetical protein [Nitrospinota bacterium]
MIDFSNGWEHVSDFVVRRLVPFVEDAADAVGDAADSVGDAADEVADEVAETAKSVAEEHAVASEALVGQKTGHALVIIAYAVIPFVLVGGAFAIKIIYGFFTKTADTVGHGLSSTASKITSALGGGDAPIHEKHEKRTLLFGEILRRYVTPSLSDEEVKKALEKQRASRRDSRIGEILLEDKVIIKSDAAKALKIQEKQSKSPDSVKE